LPNEEHTQGYIKYGALYCFFIAFIYIKSKHLLSLFLDDAIPQQDAQGAHDQCVQHDNEVQIEGK
jgi:hypothetical protein